ncbi:MAG: ATP-grasp domain-containing protein [Verrucomicrobiota bacterium]
MNLYEFQGKGVLQKAGIKVPAGKTISALSELESALEVSGLPCVIKAQLLRGKRGKAGLIASAESKEEAAEKARQIWDKEPHVETLLIEEKLDIESELYLSVMPEPHKAAANMIISKEGGVDIEEVVADNPDSIITEQIPVLTGIMPYNIRNLVIPQKLEKTTAKSLGKVIKQLYSAFRTNDATLVEINPLIVTSDGDVVAADAKVSIDDHALYRQPFEQIQEGFTSEVEYEAAKEGIPYLQFDGDIGLMCAGAGLTNTVYDLIHYHGGEPANFLEFGGPNYRKALQAMQLTLKSNPKVILVVTFGTIARADVMAEGIAEAMKQLKPEIPIVTAIRGTNEEKAAEILREVGLEPIQETEVAVQKAVELAAQQS